MRSLPVWLVVGATAATIVQAMPAEPPALLSAAEPAAVLALGVPPGRDAVLHIEVLTAQNTALTPLSLRIALQDAARRAPPVALPAIALFPADRPGAFTVRADKAIATLQGAAGMPAAPLLLIVELDPAAATLAGHVTLRAGWAPAGLMQRKPP